MSGMKSTIVLVNITSGAAQVEGTPIFVEGGTLEFHGIEAPAAVLALQVSNDRANWLAATDADAAAITNVGQVFLSVRERPVWVRVITAADGAGGNLYRVALHVMVDTG